MLNTKFIKIIILISTILLITFSIIFINKNRKNTNNTASDSVKNNTEGRVIFETNTNNTINTQENNTSTSSNQNLVEKNSDVNIVDYREGPEDITYNQINKNLYDWSTTKDPELIKQSLKLSESADNETILESWRPFMATNSSELIKLIPKSDNIQKTKSDIHLIFEWYIELSGDFEKLSSSKKQEILKQYNDLK